VLSPLSVPIAFQKYDGTSDTYITFHEYLQEGEEFDDDEETLTAISSKWIFGQRQITRLGISGEIYDGIGWIQTIMKKTYTNRMPKISQGIRFLFTGKGGRINGKTNRIKRYPHCAAD
jgi:hypothetical protein